ncbi:hypothetical protein C0J52_04034 [Blattella germanica]|nr:hypothetical protein C0J52_04034 [Blattella germanica]
MNFRLRFSMKDDLCLLKEVLAINPYEDNRRWEDISRTVVSATGKNFSLRSLKEHMMHLLKLWHRDDKANLKKSGTEEEYLEKDQLLREVSNLAYDSRNRKFAERIDRQRGIEIKQEPFDLTKTEPSERCIPILEYEEGFLPADHEDLGPQFLQGFSHISVPPSISPQQSSTSNGARKRKTTQWSNDCLMLLQIKEENKKEWREKLLEIEKEKLDLKKRKLDLEEEKFKLEKEERLARIKVQQAEQEHRIQQEKNQQVIFEKLVNLLERK